MEIRTLLPYVLVYTIGAVCTLAYSTLTSSMFS